MDTDHNILVVQIAPIVEREPYGAAIVGKGNYRC